MTADNVSKTHCSHRSAHLDYPGNLYVVSAPSGAGKSSLVKALLELDARLMVSVSHTTRAPRGQEQHGREYWFVPADEFQAMIDRGDFFEWAEVHGNRYGTSRGAIELRLQARRGCGAGDRLPGRAPDQGDLPGRGADLHPAAVVEELLQRLRRRGEDAPEVIEQRMVNARRGGGAGAPFRLHRRQRPVRHRVVRPEDHRARPAAEILGSASQPACRVRRPPSSCLTPAEDP